MSPKNMILLALFISSLLAIVIYHLYYYFLPKLNNEFIPNNEIHNMTGSYRNGVKLLFFKSSKCGYSTKAGEEIGMLIEDLQRVDGAYYNDIRIKLVTITDESASVYPPDESPPYDDLLDHYHVDGWPTVVLVIPSDNGWEDSDEKVRYFSGTITANNLKNFLKEFL